MSLVAWTIIKARSARVPGKNFRPLGGRPLVRWMVDTLLGMEEIDRLVINTDAREALAGVGVTAGSRLEIVDRPARLCGDHVTANRLLESDLDRLPEADTYLMTHATSPFLRGESIRAAAAAFRASPHHDSLMSVTRFQSRFWRSDASAVNHDPTRLVPTQELEVWLEESSAMYLFTRDGFRRAGSRVGARPMLWELSPVESLDIDTEPEWALAELVARGLPLVETGDGR